MDINELLLLDNIAEKLPSDQLVEIHGQVRDQYDADRRSRENWEQQQEKYMNLALQVMEKKDTPWEDASNVKYPLIPTAMMQFGARAYPGLISGSQIVRGMVSGFDAEGKKAAAAERVGKHMSYQLLEEMDGWEDDMDRLCLAVSIVGDMFKKTYYSPSKQRNVSELIYPKHLVVNYWAKNLKEVPITHEIFLSENQIVTRIREGVFLDQDYVKDTIPSTPEEDRAHGLTPPPQNEVTPHLFKEQHTWIDLDNDGYREPYIVTFDDNSIARIVAGYDEDTIYENCIERVEYFTKYSFVPSPDGAFYSIGFGVLLGPISKTINTNINQLNDAGTLATRAGGFLGRGAKLASGRLSFKPFEWHHLQSAGDDLRKNIYPLPVREPSNVLFSLLGLMIESGKELSSTVPMLMGQNPGQNQPATTSTIVTEQGLKVFSSIFKRLHRALKSEVKKLRRLNRLYLPESVYFNILDPEETAEEVFRNDYEEDVTDVQLHSDPNIVSNIQRVFKAQQLIELMNQNLIPNPTEATRQILEAMDLPNVQALLTPPEPAPNPEFELERIKAQADVTYKTRKLQGELAMMQAQVGEIRTKAILNLAKAQSEEDATSIDAYRAQLEDLRQQEERLQREQSTDQSGDI